MGKLLDWDNLPPNGTKVKFIEYTERGRLHDHWGFVEGDVYEIKDHESGNGDRGVECPDGQVARINFGFAFEYINQPFTKSDLKDGMRVDLRNYPNCVWVFGAVHRTEGFYNLEEVINENQINDDLTAVDLDEDFGFTRVTDRDGTVLFEREPEKVKLELEVTPEQAEAIRKQLGQ